MAETIYDVALEKMKDEMVYETTFMSTIIKSAITATGGIKNDDFIDAYCKQRGKLEALNIWQDDFDNYVEKIRDKNISEEDLDKGLAKLIEGKIE